MTYTQTRYNTRRYKKGTKCKRHLQPRLEQSSISSFSSLYSSSISSLEDLAEDLLPNSLMLMRILGEVETVLAGDVRDRRILKTGRELGGSGMCEYLKRGKESGRCCLREKLRGGEVRRLDRSTRWCLD
jgi:hypothetical protein